MKKIAKVYISGAPDEVIGSGRTKDRDSIINTIKHADKFIYISIMDFTPTSIYLESANGKALDIWWGSFYDAILYAIYQKKCNIKILVSKWAASPHTESSYLQGLEKLAQTCKISQNDPNWSGSPGFPGVVSCGTLEIRRWVMPGWDQTTQGSKGVILSNSNPKYPNFSRVNHTKYIVTDKRVNIGTSNWTWGYFFNTAGASFNSTHSSLIETCKFIFKRDWKLYGKPNIIINNNWIIILSIVSSIILLIFIGIILAY